MSTTATSAKLTAALPLVPGQVIGRTKDKKDIVLPSEQEAFNGNFSPDAVNIEAAANVIAKQYKINPSFAQLHKFIVFIIDGQDDFISGSLMVTGRDGKSGFRAVAAIFLFILKYLHIITDIIPTMDSHHEGQIFYPGAHIDTTTGEHPASNTIIPAELYNTGKMKPCENWTKSIGASFDWMLQQMKHYCNTLETPQKVEVVRQNGVKDFITRFKHQLMIWPYHTMLGNKGFNLVGLIEYVIRLHRLVRNALNFPEAKGMHPLSERFSIFREEVATDWEGKALPGTQRNNNLLKRLREGYKIVVCGFAGSHCLAESLLDLVLYLYEINRPDLIRNIYLAVDGTAAVVIPGVIDFTDDMESFFNLVADHGVNLVKLSDPIETWPNMLNLEKDLAMTV